VTPTRIAITAGVVGALLEYPLASRYPLASPVSTATRMLVAGGLVAVSVLVAARLARSDWRS